MQQQLKSVTPRHLSQLVTLLDRVVDEKDGKAVLFLPKLSKFEYDFIKASLKPLTATLDALGIVFNKDDTQNCMTFKMKKEDTFATLDDIAKLKSTVEDYLNNAELFDYDDIAQSVIAAGKAYLQKYFKNLDLTKLSRIEGGKIEVNPPEFGLEEHEWGFATGGYTILYPDPPNFRDGHKQKWYDINKFYPTKEKRLYRDFGLRTRIACLHEMIHTLQTLTWSRRPKKEGLWEKEYEACLMTLTFVKCVHDETGIFKDGLLEELVLFYYDRVKLLDASLSTTVKDGYAAWRDTFSKTLPNEDDALEALHNKTAETFYIKCLLSVEGYNQECTKQVFEDFVQHFYGDKQVDVLKSSFAIKKDMVLAQRTLPCQVKS